MTDIEATYQAFGLPLTARNKIIDKVIALVTFERSWMLTKATNFWNAMGFSKAKRENIDNRELLASFIDESMTKIGVIAPFLRKGTGFPMSIYAFYRSGVVSHLGGRPRQIIDYHDRGEKKRINLDEIPIWPLHGDMKIFLKMHVHLGDKLIFPLLVVSAVYEAIQEETPRTGPIALETASQNILAALKDAQERMLKRREIGEQLIDELERNPKLRESIGAYLKLRS
jgi:hypothetical protein